MRRITRGRLPLPSLRQKWTEANGLSRFCQWHVGRPTAYLPWRTSWTLKTFSIQDARRSGRTNACPGPTGEPECRPQPVVDDRQSSLGRGRSGVKIAFEIAKSGLEGLEHWRPETELPPFPEEYRNRPNFSLVDGLNESRRLIEHSHQYGFVYDALSALQSPPFGARRHFDCNEQVRAVKRRRSQKRAG